MILSVSRRTDIPNYYSEWFINRIKEGYLYVRNPINAHQISKIDISPQVVDCIVFWTKNPKNMMGRLDELKEYNYYFQFTITGYGKDVEPNIPDKRTEIIPAFQELSRKIGKEAVIWRYDPIFFSAKYTKEYHLKAFEEIASKLCDYTEKVIISFVDIYAKTQRNTAELEIIPMTQQDMLEIAEQMGKIASGYGLIIETCAEGIDLSHIGIQHGSCIDLRRIEKLIDCKVVGEKDKNQRSECGCAQSIEVGTYNTCKNGCKYCYANFNDTQVKNCVQLYDVNAPLLCGSIGGADKITERKVKSMKDVQMDI